MTDLMVDFITSLDGYGSAEGWPGLWGMGGQDYFDWMAADAAAEYALVMGANTYRLFADMAEQGDDEGIADLTRRPKTVFSHTLTEPLGWANTTLVAADAVEEVRSLKRSGAPPLRTIGSPTLCAALTAAGLVDRYRVVVFPVVNGETGRDPVYRGWPDVGLEMVDARTFDGGLQLFEFVPTVLDAASARREVRMNSSHNASRNDGAEASRRRAPRKPPSGTVDHLDHSASASSIALRANQARPAHHSRRNSS